ncbi:hypothetical protein V2J09_005436 [Rumex salicifolius]
MDSQRSLGSQSAGDSTVPDTQDVDATMVDVGRPPGVDLGRAVSWAGKVAGGGSGGMPVPEEILDDEFVMSKLHLGFPNGEDGEPEVTIDQEILDAMNGLWKQCMIVRVLGRNVSILALDRKLRDLWKPRGGMNVVDLPRQFFMVRFELEEDYMAALTGGPWRAFASYLLVQAWSPDFDPLCDDIVTTPVWVRLSNLPMNYYHRAILKGIAEGLGKPVKVDMTTLKLERGRFARVCVEVNLKRPLKGTVLVNGERYFVSYEGLSNICSGCGVYGHLVAVCPRRPKEQVVPEQQNGPESSEMGERRQAGQMEDGFTAAKNPVRSHVMQGGASLSEKSGGAPAGVKVGENRILKTRDPGDILVSNRFENLVEDQDIRKLGEVDNSVAIIKGKNEVETMKSWEPFVARAKSGTQVMRKEKVNSIGKGKEKQTSKPKSKKQAGPTRGLIFGPTKGERGVVTSGKRLRIEPENVGRLGGAFVNAEDLEGTERPLRSVVHDEVVSTEVEPMLVRMLNGLQMALMGAGLVRKGLPSKFPRLFLV